MGRLEDGYISIELILKGKASKTTKVQLWRIPRSWARLHPFLFSWNSVISLFFNYSSFFLRSVLTLIASSCFSCWEKNAGRNFLASKETISRSEWERESVSGSVRERSKVKWKEATRRLSYRSVTHYSNELCRLYRINCYNYTSLVPHRPHLFASLKKLILMSNSTRYNRLISVLVC